MPGVNTCIPVNKPRIVSLSQLLTLGYLSENDVSTTGEVESHVRESAERAYVTANRRKSSLMTSPTRSPSHLTTLHCEKQPPSSQCCICFTLDRHYAFAPCYHLCVCRECAYRLDKCPICRSEVTSIHRIYC